MSSISKVSLEDTYYLVQLAREAALARGRQAQADQLKPVMDGMRPLVEKPEAKTEGQPAPVSSLTADPGFQKLLELSSRRAEAGSQPAAINPPAGQVNRPAGPAAAGRPAVDTTSLDDRNRLVQAMAAGGASNLDIARQLGMSREEVGLTVEAGRKAAINRR